MSLLEVDSLDVTVGLRHGEVKALDGVSFTLEAGEVLGLVGESGSGKSLTALAIQRLLPRACRITSGEVRFDGTNLARLTSEEMRKLRGPGMAQIFQDPLSSLNPVLKIGFQIAEAIQMHERLARCEIRSRVLDLLNLVGISEPERRIHQYPHELSGGMRQRVMIAMALSCRPRLLIADEPTTALDVTIQAQILRLLRGLQRRFQMASMFITHDLGVISQFADRLAVMYGGRIVELGPVETVIRSPAHPYTKALLLSIPALTPETERLPAIRGTVPALDELPSGCKFRPRCDLERPACATLPADFMVAVPSGQLSACVLHAGSSA